MINQVKAAAENLIKRVMNMQTFKIIRPLPDEFEFRGPAPFDIRVDKECIMTFTVHCMTLQEANQMVDEYLEKNSI
jgi:hypothetical protein